MQTEFKVMGSESDGNVETFTLNSLDKSAFGGVSAFHLTECNTKTVILG